MEQPSQQTPCPTRTDESLSHLIDLAQDSPEPRCECIPFLRQQRVSRLRPLQPLLRVRERHSSRKDVLAGP